MKKKGNVFLAGILAAAMLLCGGCASEPKKSETPKAEDDRPVVVWDMGDYWERGEAFTEYFNDLLKKYGCSYQVEFQMTFIPDEVYGNEGFAEAYTDENFASADILTLAASSWYADLYEYYGLQGCFQSLDKWMDTELGQQLYQAYPENAWESFRIHGELMGVGKLLPERSAYLVLNQEYLEKYGIEKEERTLEEWLEIAGSVVEKERAGRNDSFEGIFSYAFHQAPGSDFLRDPVGLVVYEEDGKLRSGHFLYDEAYLSLIRGYNQGMTEGYCSDQWQRISTGNFFGAVVNSYCAEAAVGNLKTRYDCPKDLELTGVRLKEWDMPFRGYGIKTVIPKGAEQADGAFEVLAMSYSTPELTDALIYGIEGKDYEIKDGRTTIKPDFWARFLGNSLIATPCFYEPQNRAELLQEQLGWETESPILGFYLDITKMKEDWVSVVLASWDHEELYTGVSEDVEAEIEQARKDLEEAGLDRVLEEIDRQLEEWQKGKEG